MVFCCVPELVSRNYLDVVLIKNLVVSQSPLEFSSNWLP